MCVEPAPLPAMRRMRTNIDVGRNGDRRVASVGCYESKGDSPFSSGVTLNSSRGINLRNYIAGPGKVRCEVAGMVISSLHVLLFAVVVLQLNWRLALPSVLVLLNKSPIRRWLIMPLGNEE
jgi:hypothetical protein